MPPSKRTPLLKASGSALFSKPAAGRQRGIALVIVLGFLVLLTVLIVAFFTSVSNEYQSSKTFVAGASTRFLSDAAVNVVMGQIVEGTKGQGTSVNVRRTWASQPGMIRTYEDSGNGGNAYKLYSAARMVVPGSTSMSQEMASDLPKGWEKMPALFTDLNAPVTDANQHLHFPILDGNVNVKQPLTVNGKGVYTYHDAGSSKPEVEGFGIDSTEVPNFDPSEPISAVNNPAAMPVLWMYSLKDGTLISPDPNGDGTTVTFDNSSKKPTADNPITGRIAFWADDESSKLNINTASEGSYYGFPHSNSPTDMQPGSGTSGKSFGFAISPPATHEYNRYPGHPATTCLSVALGKWVEGIPRVDMPTAYTTKANDDVYLAKLRNYLSISPRVSYGGSAAGTIDGSDAGGATAIKPISPSTAAADDLLTDRLYTSVDELMFRPSRQQSSSLPNVTIDNVALERLRFFLTASSRAPEVTPYNTPKISMWPQWSQVAERNAAATSFTNPWNNAVMSNGELKASSKLLAFCSSFGTGSGPSGKNEYFFQRLNTSSWTSSTQDWTVTRNRDLALYINRMCLRKIPGYGAEFASKYSQSQLGSLIVGSLDYIRSSMGRTAFVSGDVKPGGSIGTWNNDRAWHEYVAPLVVTGGIPGATPFTPLKGFGHYPVCTQIALGAALDSSNKVVPVLAFQFFVPTQSFPFSTAGVPVTVDNVDNLGITGPTTITTTSGGWTGAYNAWQNGRTMYFGYYNNNAGAPMMTYTWVLNNASFATSDATTVTLGNGNPVTFKFMDVDGPNGNVVQQVKVRFPNLKVNKPTVKQNLAGVASANPTNFMASLGALSMRSVECRDSGAGGMRGDWRLLAAMGAVDQVAGGNAFSPNPSISADYANPSVLANLNDPKIQQVHSLRVYLGPRYDGVNSNAQPIRIGSNSVDRPSTSVAGSLTGLLKNTEYSDWSAPCAPVGMSAALNWSGKPGDWDTGPGLSEDGPYINPTDQSSCVGLAQHFTGSQKTQVDGIFSPNRLAASPVRFGSLPTGVDANSPKPWQTLLFCPNPAARDPNTSVTPGNPVLGGQHWGFKNPPDHLYLEFFTMPTVEPYAISEPLSTAGKVNLNYQLAPFTGIERSTALRGVLKGTQLAAISGNDVKYTGVHPSPKGVGYKYGGDNGNFNVTPPQTPPRYSNEIHYEINRDVTLEGINKYYFEKGNIFKYASEICDVFLIPSRIAGAKYAGAPTPTKYDQAMHWWSGQGLASMDLTGDNLREEPYDRIYPRVTTKSNTFTVHYRVQVLKKRTNSNPATWQEDKDQVLAESRGATMIERYIDPSDASLDDGWDQETRALNLQGKADLSQYYRFRIISSKKFAP